MGLKLTTPDPENFGLLILKVADGTAGSLLAFLEHRLMSFSLTLQCALLTFVALVCGIFYLHSHPPAPGRPGGSANGFLMPAARVAR